MEIKSPRQVDLLYALFLGRLPENNLMRHENLDRPILDLVNAMVTSDEFRQSILERFLSYGTLPHNALPLRLLPEALALIAAAGLAQPVEGFVEADWKSALVRLLSHPPCYDIIEAAHGEDARKLIEKLGGAKPASHAREVVLPPDIVWGAEVVAQTICRGWVLDRTHPDAPLHVRLRINGSIVKTMQAHEFRRDVQDRLGGNGHCGFTLRLDLLPGIAQLSRATIEISELSSGTILLPDYVIELSTVPRINLEAELREEVQRLRAAFDDLKRQLREPSLERPSRLAAFFWPHSARAAEQSLLQLYKSFDRFGDQLTGITRDLAEYVRRDSWTLSLYNSIRSSVKLVIEPEDIEKHCTFSVLILNPLAPSAEALERTLASVLNQILQPAEIFILLPDKLQFDHRASSAIAIDVIPLTIGQTAGQAANNIASRTTSSYLLIMDAGVVLMPECLAWAATASSHTGAPLVYTDREILNRSNDGHERFLPAFLPAFDYDLLLQENYIGTTFFIRRDSFELLGGFVQESAVDIYHDLLLRASTRFGEAGFVHLPLVLLSQHANAGVQQSAESASDLTIRTVQQHLGTTAPHAKAVKHTDSWGRPVVGAATIDWTPDNATDRISVIIPTRDRADLVFALLSSLKRHTALPDQIEVIVAVGNRSEPHIELTFSELINAFTNVKVVYRDDDFNWAAINNTTIRDTSQGDIVVCLNDDMICLTKHWDNRLRGQLARQQIGVVGGRLLYPSGPIQHAGITFCGGGVTAHEAMGDAPDDGLYLNRTLLVHQIGAVTGAFLACRRTLFDQLGGFDAERYVITSSDADFCVRARLQGKSVIYDPSLTWIHYESVSRGNDTKNYARELRAEAEHERWSTRFSPSDLIDLSLNPHLTYSSRPFESFHRPTYEDIKLWLGAQHNRAEYHRAR